MEDINFGEITLQDCLDNYNMRNRTIEINDGKVVDINYGNNNDITRNN